MSNYRTFLLSALIFSLSACEKIHIFPPDAVLPDSGEYRGDIVDGLFEGEGTLHYSHGAFYDGSFRGGLMHGQGKYLHADGSVYEGTFFEGVIHGPGRLETPVGEIYEGDFVNGVLTGTATITYPELGVEYSGEVKNWLYHGQGTLKSEDGDYVGDFEEGLFHGTGALSYPDGSAYTGEFERGEMHGEGRLDTSFSAYEGEFIRGNFTGKGVYTTPYGERYEGEFKDWLYHGQGQYTDEDGNQSIGAFENGVLNGEASFVGADGERYEGEVSFGQYHGKGHLMLPDATEYSGHFFWGQYHGEGALTLIESEGEKVIKEGIWHEGTLVYDSLNSEYSAPQAELALENHQRLLQELLSGLSEGDPEKIDSYFLGIGGDGTEGVFRRELEFVEALFLDQYGTQNRSVNLINSHEGAEQYPLATVRSVSTALETIGEKMNPEQDILFMYISSHGSAEHDISIDHDLIELRDISAQYLADTIADQGIQWKVIIISACYSGGFIPFLEDERTLIMTASDAESTSFGCSDDSEMTNFGKALFRDVLTEDPQLNFDDAFDQAKQLIELWEEQDDLEVSNPQIDKPEEILEHLQNWRRQANI